MSPREQFAWREAELKQIMPNPSAASSSKLVILAADVIYDEGLTEALFDVLKILMPPPASAHSNGERDPIVYNCDGVGNAPTPVSLGSIDQGSSALVEGTSARPLLNDVKRKEAFVYARSAAGYSAETCENEAILYLAMEKRFNFSIEKLSVAATGYSALLRNVVDVTDGFPEIGEEIPADPQAFFGERIPLQFSQCFRYDRSEAMELWKIKRRPATKI